MQILTVGQSSHDEDDGEKMASGQQQQSKQDLRTAMQKKGKSPRLPSLSHYLLCVLPPFPILSPSLSTHCYSVFLLIRACLVYSVISENYNGVLSHPKEQELSGSQGCDFPICTAALLLRYQADANAHTHLFTFLYCTTLEITSFRAE